MSRTKIFAFMKGHKSGTNMSKRTSNNPKPDLVNMNANIEFGVNISICSKISSGNEIMTDVRSDGRTDGQTELNCCLKLFNTLASRCSLHW